MTRTPTNSVSQKNGDERLVGRRKHKEINSQNVIDAALFKAISLKDERFQLSSITLGHKTLASPVKEKEIIQTGSQNYEFYKYCIQSNIEFISKKIK